METASEKLIVKLIQQDLKHNQLTVGLQKIGLDTNLHDLEIIDVVAQLMGIKDISNEWLETYISFLEQSSKFEVSDNGKDLTPLAKACYKELLQCAYLEAKQS